MGPNLSKGTRERIDRTFAPEDREKAARMLEEECGNNLPFLEGLDSMGLERFRYAAIKVSRGDLAELRRAVELARVDWRDLLMWAGFGHDVKAHEKWMPAESEP